MPNHQAQLMQTGNTIYVSAERGICQSNALENTWATKQLRAVQLRKATPLPSAVTNPNLSPSPNADDSGAHSPLQDKTLEVLKTFSRKRGRQTTSEFHITLVKWNFKTL